LAFIPSLITIGASMSFFGTDFYTGRADPLTMRTKMFSPTGIALLYVLPMITYGISTTLIVLAAYDAKLGRAARIGEYFVLALRRAFPAVVITTIVTLIGYVGLIFLLVPGLYLFALFSMAVCVVVLESQFFGALRRSVELTKNYRWPILGTMMLLVLILVVVQAALSVALLSAAKISIIIALIGYAVMGAFGASLLSIGVVMIYARLREIKEGVGVDSLADIFS